MKKKWDKKSIVKNVILAGIALFLLGTIVFLGMFAWYSRDLPDPGTLILREVPQSTKIYDKTGEHLLYEISGDEKRTLVTLDEIPDFIPQATITAEDRKFYEHGGFDLKGIIRAVLVNVSTLNPTGQGASTITQQLVKNSILTNEKTISRKVKELVLSIALERRYEKDEILQMYLNEIPYGSTNYGIESAAQAYFSKPASDLTLAEGATLAGLPKAPTTYLNNPERLLERRNWILNDMKELGYIGEEALQEALLEETSITPSASGINAPHFVFWVKELLVEEYGERAVEQGGLRVITSLDFDKQQIAEEAVVSNVAARGETYGYNNTGLVSIDPKTGHVIAMVGSADYFDEEIDGAVNTTLRPLQPGSSFKPIMYTAGFEAGYTPNTILWDVNTTFPSSSGPYNPRNFDFKERGPITVRKALQGSLNIPAVKMLYLIGVENGLSFAERLGYTTLTDRSRFGLAVVLGGAEVKPLEHTAAYATFAAEGIYREPVAILKVEDSNGEVLQEWEETEGEKVLEINHARMITDVLSDDNARAYIFGTGSNLTLPGRPAAAKTGTTNDAKDGWTVGYTPQLATAVWAGNTDGSVMSSNSGGYTVASPVWREYMKKAHADLPVEYFGSATIPITGKDILDGIIPSQTIVIDTASGKLATDLTPESYREEKVCGEYHNILSYVNTSDPLGAAPSNPEAVNSAWTNWESAVETWITSQNEQITAGEIEGTIIKNCEIPEEEDDVHVAANIPTIKIKEPDNNNKINRTFDLAVRASSRRGISRLEVLIDDRAVHTSTNRSDLTITLPSWVEPGEHTLTVAAYDDVDNMASDSVSVEVDTDVISHSFSITNPFNNQVIVNDGNPYTIVAENSQASDHRIVELSYMNLQTQQVTFLQHINNPGPVVSVPWTLPNAGGYLLFIRSTTKNGDQIDGQPVRVFVKNTPSSP